MCSLPFAPAKKLITMEELGINYQQAKDLVAKYITDDITRYHCLESEAVMRGLAKHFGEDEEAWGIIGLLHDIDWCLTKDDTSQHCLKTAEILKSAGGTDFLIETIQSHGYELEDHGFVGPKEFIGKKRTTKIQYALAAGETITGLIVASALVQPDKKLASVGVASVLKKFKNRKDGNKNRVCGAGQYRRRRCEDCGQRGGCFSCRG